MDRTTYKNRSLKKSLKHARRADCIIETYTFGSKNTKKILFDFIGPIREIETKVDDLVTLQPRVHDLEFFCCLADEFDDQRVFERLKKTF